MNEKDIRQDLDLKTALGITLIQWEERTCNLIGVRPRWGIPKGLDSLLRSLNEDGCALCAYQKEKVRQGRIFLTCDDCPARHPWGEEAFLESRPCVFAYTVWYKTRDRTHDTYGYAFLAAYYIRGIISQAIRDEGFDEEEAVEAGLVFLRDLSKGDTA